jgi:solute:Na+ symporter, SSS family
MEIQAIDWLVIITYIGTVFFLAIKAGKSSQTISSDIKEKAQAQYLAGKSLTFTESICSIIATEVSALTFLGIPAFAFNNNFSFIQIYMGAILGRLVIARILLPKIYDQGLTVYEVMAKDSGLPSGQRMVAIFYSLAKVLSVGVRLFSGSILVSHFMKIDIYLGLGLVTFMTFLYTLIGGLKAVVRTDIMQMILFVSGGIIAHFLIPETSGQSWIDLMSLAHSSGKTSFFSVENPWPFILGIMGGFLFDIATHGVDQDFAQRLMANRSLKNAQLAIFLSSFLSIVVGLIFLGIGALLWSFYQSQSYPSEVTSADHLFSHFIVNYFPSGIRGLMVAGVLAATMSTLDSTINAVCATVYNDILPNRKSSNLRKNTILDTLVITILLFIIAIVASKNDGLLLLGLKVQSWSGGALLGIFLTKVIFKQWFSYRLNPTSVIGAYLFGTLGVYLNLEVLSWDWNLNVYWGVIMSMFFLKIYSLIKPAK